MTFPKAYENECTDLETSEADYPAIFVDATRKSYNNTGEAVGVMRLGWFNYRFRVISAALAAL